MDGFMELMFDYLVSKQVVEYFTDGELYEWHKARYEYLKKILLVDFEKN